MKRSISASGEFGLIAGIRSRLVMPSSVVQGPGDDCAVVSRDSRTYQLFTCDMLVQDVDFTSKDDPFLIGAKAVSVSLSDIAACAGIPRYCLVSAGLPSNYPKGSFDRLLDGMLSRLKQFNTVLIGGDLSKSDKLVLDVSMTGTVEKKRLVLRSGARPGDLIFVTGPLGGTITGKHLDFTPRVREARALASGYRIHAMIDISDGLCQDVGHIASESGVGAVLYERLIPVRPEAQGVEDALYGGEDFELLFTVSRQDAKRLMRQKTLAVFPVGEITQESGVLRLVDAQGGIRRLEQKGYRHF